MSENNISVERDFAGTLHIKVGEFDFIQIRYQYPHTDNASTRALADRIVALLAQPAEADGVEVVAFIQTGNGMKPAARIGTPADLYFPGGDASGYTFEPLMTVAQHRRILSAVTAERDGLATENERLARDAKNDAIAYRAAIERQEELRAEVKKIRSCINEH